MKKAGFVLSGGGVRGYAHLGVLQYIEENGIKPYAVSGTSAGAIVGALYTAGKSPQDVLRILKSNKYFGWSTLLWNKAGFFSMDTLKKTLTACIDVNNFNALQIRLFVTATDFSKGKSITFSSGELFDAVIASASVPVIFQPVLMNDMVLVDGGVLNNFPVEPLKNICDVIIGSHVNNIQDDLPASKKMHSIHALERCFHMAIASSVYSKVADCDLFLDAPLHGFRMFDTKRADDIFEIGYNTAKAQHSRIMKLVDG